MLTKSQFMSCVGFFLINLILILPLCVGSSKNQVCPGEETHNTLQSGAGGGTLSFQTGVLLLKASHRCGPELENLSLETLLFNPCIDYFV